MWTRRPEHGAFVSLRLGLGRMRSRSELELPGDRKGVVEHWKLIEELAAKAYFVDGVPVRESFADSGNIGIAGTRGVASAVARGVVAQLVGLHSPAELVLAAVASTASAAEWTWLKWLPHVGSPHSPLAAAPLATGGQGTSALVAEIDELIESRRAAKAGLSPAWARVRCSCPLIPHR